ncbi:hypothetical protein Rruber_05555 (plasmid) [Rhodococcus ruber]
MLSERRAEILKRISDNQRDLERALSSLERVDKAAARRDTAIAKATETFETKKHEAELAASKSLAQVVARGETPASIAELVGLDASTVRRLLKLVEQSDTSEVSEETASGEAVSPLAPVAASQG